MRATGRGGGGVGGEIRIWNNVSHVRLQNTMTSVKSFVSKNASLQRNCLEAWDAARGWEGGGRIDCAGTRRV